MSLAGRRIVVTRAMHQADELAHLITDAGGMPVLYPCIEIAPPDNLTELDKALEQLHTFDRVIFTSTNAVEAVHNRLRELEMTVNWANTKIATVGSKTDHAILEHFGWQSDFMPSHYKAEDLAEQLPITHGERLFIPQSARADDSLSKKLTERGVAVTVVDAYRTVIGSGGEDVPALAQKNLIDAVTFTSGSTVDNFVKRIAPLTAFELPAVCIGPSTFAVASDLGFHHAQHPEKHYSLRSMLQLLHDYFEEVSYGNT